MLKVYSTGDAIVTAAGNATLLSLPIPKVLGTVFAVSILVALFCSATAVTGEILDYFCDIPAARGRVFTVFKDTAIAAILLALTIYAAVLIVAAIAPVF